MMKNVVSKKWEIKKRKEWERNASFWVKIIRENLDPFRLIVTNKAILEPIKGRKNLKILDAGCGEGYLCRILAKKGHRVFGIDFCRKLIESARELEKKKALGIKYFYGDFRRTNFPSSYFDLILSHQTINEISNPETAFKEFWRILKKGGKVICLFLHPCFDFPPAKIKNKLFSLLYFQKTKIKKGKYLVGGILSPSPYFYLHLPLSKWLEILGKTGFSILKIKEPHPPLNLLKKNKWWKENFDRPRFILIEAKKI
jgi:ubiquinone/menaquinone biosynthesis C-methylase UbiE